MTHDDDRVRLICPPGGWSEPIPLDPPRPPAPAFPLDVFPDWITDHVTSIARATQTDPTLGATVALGALSAAFTLRHVTVHIDDSWVDGANLYLACVLPSGATKSPVYNQLMAPLVEGVAGVHGERMAERKRAESRLRVIEQRIKKAEDALVRDPYDPAAQGDLDSAWHDRETFGELPGAGVELHDDITPEEVAHQLKAADGVMVVASDEGGFLDGLDRYIDTGKASNLNAVLKAHSGGRVTVARRSHDPIVIPSARMAICLTCQPTVVDRLMANPEYAGRGLPARFMLSYPRHLIGDRDFLAGHTIDEVAKARYEAQFGAMWDDVDRRDLRYSIEALERLRFWRHVLEHGQREGEELAHMRPHVAKVVTSAARVAGILHVAWGRSGTVSVDTVQEAITVGTFWMDTLLSVVPVHDERSVDRIGAKSLLSWLERRDNPTANVTLRDISRSGALRASHGARVDQFASAVQMLVEHGWLWPAETYWDNTTPRAKSPEFGVAQAARQRLTPLDGEWRSEHGEGAVSRQSRVALNRDIEEIPPISSLSPTISLEATRHATPAPSEVVNGQEPAVAELVGEDDDW